MTLNRIKKVVVVGHDNEGSARLFESLVTAFPDVEFLLVIGQGLYYRRSFVSSAVKMLREASWWFVFFRFVELVKYKLFYKTLKDIAKPRSIRIVYTRDVNHPDFLALVSEFAPDLLVSLFTMQIYKASILKLPRFGAITSHPSILPRYRGLEVFFWVLANGEHETGVSVFFLDVKIDAGRVFRQETVPISAEDSVASLYGTITDVGGRLLVEAIRDIDQENVNFIPPSGPESYFGMPDPESFRRFRRTGRKFF